MRGQVERLGLVDAQPSATEVVSPHGGVLPKGWVLRVYYKAFMSPDDLAHARALELSGHLDFWRQEPDLYQ